MEAITREERLLDGQDLEPITRKEMFIKRIYDKTQYIPEPITREEHFLKIAGESGGDITIEQLTVTENGEYSAQGVAYSPVIVNVPTPPSYLVKDVPNLPQAVASFDDAIVAPIIKLKADIEPVQSGSGDPYPAGGGKNKFNKDGTDTNNGYMSGVYINSNDATTPNSSYNVSEYIPVSESTQYVLSGMTVGTNPSICYYASDKTFISGEKYNGRSPLVFTTPATTAYVRFSVVIANANTAQLEVGNQATSYAPYSNIRPISGWDGANVWVQAVVDPTAEADYSISWQTECGTIYGGTLDVTNGVLTVDRGYVDLGDLNWTYLTSGSGLAPYFYAGITSLGVKYEGNFGTVVYPVLCSIYKTVNRNLSVFIDNTLCMDGAVAEQTVTQVQVKDSRYTSASDFKTAMNGIQIVYELATPQTYQLTPTEVKSLLGVNNIFADCGDVEECRYITGTL